MLVGCCFFVAAMLRWLSFSFMCKGQGQTASSRGRVYDVRLGVGKLGPHLPLCEIQLGLFKRKRMDVFCFCPDPLFNTDDYVAPDCSF